MRLLLLGLVLSLGGCETEADRRRERLDRVAHTLEGRLAAADLPTVPHGETWAAGGVRVVAGEGIDVDRAAGALAFYRADPVGYAESIRPIPEPGTRAVVLTGGRPDAMAYSGSSLGGLAEAIRPRPPPGTMGETTSRSTLPEHRGPVDLAIGSRIPYATFAEILHTVVQERFSPRLVVRIPGELGQLPIRTPAIAGGCWSTRCIVALVARRTIPEPDAEAGPPSNARLRLTLAIDERGVDLFGSGGALARGCEEVRPAEESSPTVPRVEGAIDRRSLEQCLNEIAELFPDADDVLIQPESDTPFGDVALVASLAFDADRFPGLFFAEPD